MDCAVKVFLTGANGFVGSALLNRLILDNTGVVALVRCETTILPDGVQRVVGDLMASSSMGEDAFDGVDVVVHAAARAHIMRDEVADPLAEYRRVNVEGTLALAKQAALAGVKRFVYISSIKVNGERTYPAHLGPLPKGAREIFRADDVHAPEDAYGISKLEAEQGLFALARETGMEVVIIRPPLVYGPGVKGNLASLIRVVAKRLPLPLGAIHNRRSLVGLDNLVDLIVTCVNHPAAANQVFLAGDGQDLSTTELLRSIARAMDKPSRLIPVPAGMLMLGATLLGKKAMAQRLLGSLQVDISKARTVLGWEPPVSVEEGIKRMVDG